MCRLHREHTVLCEISTVNKIDGKVQTKVKQKVLKVIIHNNT